jgi:cytidine deaminase
MALEISKASDKIKELYQVASLVRENAYCPYSGHKVGAAIKTTEGEIYSGCNIENSSFGATQCAERVAIQKAISEKGQIHIQEVLVITDSTPPWPPCGMCRQVIGEFAKEITTIYTANLNGEFETFFFKELFPKAFTSLNLK